MKRWLECCLDYEQDAGKPAVVKEAPVDRSLQEASDKVFCLGLDARFCISVAPDERFEHGHDFSLATVEFETAFDLGVLGFAMLCLSITWALENSCLSNGARSNAVLVA